jgi:hypothetical protein
VSASASAPSSRSAPCAASSSGRTRLA